MKYKAIMAGVFGSRAVNVRFQQVWEELEAIKAQLGITDDQKETKTVNTAQTEVISTEVANTPPEDAFDWKTCDDAQVLKEFALSEFGLEIKGNKKADTVRKEIEGFLTT